MLHVARTGAILSSMRRLVALLGLVAGCYSPTVQPGLPCAENRACPSGQTCMRGVCSLETAPDARTDGSIDPPGDATPPDGPSPDGPPSDLDADGIANAMDNCPTANNPDQHDEDVDTVGDACDNCPHVSNTTQANALEGAIGADAVGDACDPNPTAGGDTIDRFLSFHVMPTGITTDGSWTMSQDAFVKSGVGRAELIVSGVRARYTVEIAGAELSSGGTNPWVTIFFGQAAGKYHDCGYDQPTADLHDGVLGYYDGTDWNLLYAVHHNLAAPLNGAFKILLSADAALDHAACTTSDSRGTAASGNRDTPVLVPGEVGVRSDNMSFRIDYLIIFGST